MSKKHKTLFEEFDIDPVELGKKIDASITAVSNEKGFFLFKDLADEYIKRMSAEELSVLLVVAYYKPDMPPIPMSYITGEC